MSNNILLTAVSGFVFLAGCGFGEGENRNMPADHYHHQAVAGSSTIYLPYYAKTQIGTVNNAPWSATALYAVNPQAPGTNPIQIYSTQDQSSAVNLIPRARLKTGHYDSAKFKVHDYHESGLLYSLDGRFFVTMFDGGSDMLMPVRVSSETAANTICDDLTAYHYPTPHHTIFLYQMPVSGTCASGTLRWYAVTVGDPDTQSRRVLPEGVEDIVVTIHKQSDASIEGFLVVNNVNGQRQLQFMDAEFIMDATVSAPTLTPIQYSDDLPVTNAADALWLAMPSVQVHWLRVNNRFVIYDHATKKIRMASNVTDALPLNKDANNVYNNDLVRVFPTVDALLATVYRNDSNGNTTVAATYRFPNADGYGKKVGTEFVASKNGVSIWLAYAGANGVVYSEYENSTGNLYFRHQDWDTSKTPRDIYTVSQGAVLNDVYVTDTHMFIEIINSNNFLEVLHGAWTNQTLVFTSYDNDGNGTFSRIASTVYDGELDPVLDSAILKTLIIQNWTESDGMTLYAINAANGERVRKIGRLFNGYQVSAPTYGVFGRSDGLLMAGVYDSARDLFTKPALYYFDSDVADSLHRSVNYYDGLSSCMLPNRFPYDTGIRQFVGFDNTSFCQ